MKGKTKAYCEGIRDTKERLKEQAINEILVLRNKLKVVGKREQLRIMTTIEWIKEFFFIREEEII